LRDSGTRRLHRGLPTARRGRPPFSQYRRGDLRSAVSARSGDLRRTSNETCGRPFRRGRETCAEHRTRPAVGRFGEVGRPAPNIGHADMEHGHAAKRTTLDRRRDRARSPPHGPQRRLETDQTRLAALHQAPGFSAGQNATACLGRQHGGRRDRQRKQRIPRAIETVQPQHRQQAELAAEKILAGVPVLRFDQSAADEDRRGAARMFSDVRHRRPPVLVAIAHHTAVLPPLADHAAVEHDRRDDPQGAHPSPETRRARCVTQGGPHDRRHGGDDQVAAKEQRRVTLDGGDPSDRQGNQQPTQREQKPTQVQATVARRRCTATAANPPAHPRCHQDNQRRQQIDVQGEHIADLPDAPQRSRGNKRRPVLPPLGDFAQVRHRRQEAQTQQSKIERQLPPTVALLIRRPVVDRRSRDEESRQTAIDDLRRHQQKRRVVQIEQQHPSRDPRQSRSEPQFFRDAACPKKRRFSARSCPLRPMTPIRPNVLRSHRPPDQSPEEHHVQQPDQLDQRIRPRLLSIEDAVRIDRHQQRRQQTRRRARGPAGDDQINADHQRHASQDRGQAQTAFARSGQFRERPDKRKVGRTLIPDGGPRSQLLGTVRHDPGRVQLVQPQAFADLDDPQPERQSDDCREQEPPTETAP